MKELFTAAIVIIAFIAAMYFLLWHLPKEGWHVKTVENGEHQGYITAIETEGIWWKVKTAYIKTDLASSQEDKYCLIASPEVEAQLATAMREKAPVTLVFEDYLIRGWANCANGTAVAIGLK